VYHAFWFLSALPVDCSAVLDSFPRIRGWMTRVAAIGHGSFRAMSSAEALRVAALASPPSPPTPRASHPAPFDPPLGARVSVRPEEYTTEETSGTLVHLDADEITLERTEPSLGTLLVHFPRLGYASRTHEK
jgi:hypothetical protein